MTEKQKGYKTLWDCAERLRESIRDTGYSVESALADIVYNILSAGPPRMAISNDLDVDRQAYPAVPDDGSEMGVEDLLADNPSGFVNRRKKTPSSSS